MNAPPHLRGEFIETLGPKRKCRGLRRRRQNRRNCEMESRVKSDGLAHGPEILIEMLELTAHRFQAECHRGRITDVIFGTKKSIERGLDER